MTEKPETNIAPALEDWLRAARAHTLPAWEELPAIPLYMDQVILYLRENLALFWGEGEKTPLLTSSMINNYVKNGVIPRAEKKKYGREHLATLMVVCVLKQVLSLPEIKALLRGLPLTPQLYEQFRRDQAEAMQAACDTVDLQGDLPNQALRLAVRANAGRAVAQAMNRKGAVDG